MKLEFSLQIFEKYSNIYFNENLYSWSRVVPSGQMDGQTNMKLIVAFRSFADTSNKGNFICPMSKYNTIEERKYDKYVEAEHTSTHKSCDDRTWQYNVLTKTLNTEFYVSNTFNIQPSIQTSFYFVRKTRVDESYIYIYIYIYIYRVAQKMYTLFTHQYKGAVCILFLGHSVYWFFSL
jgi:hypothetical protein